MYRVPTHKIRTGMKLAQTITLDQNREYLVAGATLRESYITLLLKHGITSVYVMSECAPDVVPQDVVKPQTRAELTDELRQVIKEIEASFQKAANGSLRRVYMDVDLSGIRRSIDKVIAELTAQPTVVYNLSDIRRADEATLGHSVNVAILSTLLGTEVGYTQAELRDLALGALLHDVGKVTTPESILKKPGRLTREEFEIMTCHTIEGWEILRRQRQVSPRSSIVALQHHERWSGGGYPYSLVGEEIYRFARICAIADCFDAMTSDRVYRPGLSSAAALKILTASMKDHFEPSLLWSFTQCVAPYPVGTLVELTGGVQAVVVQTIRRQAHRPKVRLVRFSSSEPVKDQIELDLSEHPELEISRVITEGGDTLESVDAPVSTDAAADHSSSFSVLSSSMSKGI